MIYKDAKQSDLLTLPIQWPARAADKALRVPQELLACADAVEIASAVVRWLFHAWFL